MLSRLLISTSNAHKAGELREALAGRPIELVTPDEIDLNLQVEESGSSFAENALLKATAFHRSSGLPALADDSGLSVDALGGEPGVRSARLGGAGKTDRDRVEIILQRLRGVPRAARTAQFTAVLAMVCEDLPEPIVCVGTAEGVITERPKGTNGFGYDPIFYFPPLTRTFAELTREEKLSVSHRGKALRCLLDALDAFESEHILA